MQIEELIVKLSEDPFNPDINFAVAREYEELEQYASAVSFYMRAAEYGADVDGSLTVYTSLLKLARCFGELGNRDHTVGTCLFQAVAYMPNRPEGYFLLSQSLEYKKSWQECYTWAKIGLAAANHYGLQPLPADVGYFGSYCLEFEMAVSSWWFGQKDESARLFTELRKQELAPIYKQAVEANMRSLGMVWEFTD